MSKAELFRRKAQEAERKAEQVPDLEAKLTWREIAEHWRDLAGLAERQELSERR
jgi:hypothetical protein